MTNASISTLEQYLGFFLCYLLSGFSKVASMFGGKQARDQASKRIVFVKFIEQGALVLHKGSFEEAARQYGPNNVFLCTFLSNAQLVDILGVFPAENKIYINEKSLWQFATGFIGAILRIRKLNIDSAIDLEFFSRATAVFCFLTGAKKRAGYHRYQGLQNYRGDLFTHKLSYSHYVHVGDSSWSLLKSLELPVKNLPALDIQLNDGLTEICYNPTGEDLGRLDRLLGYVVADSDLLIVINPSLNDVLPLRRWPEEYFKQFIYRFKELYPRYKFVFTGRGDEQEMTNRFMAELNLQNAVNLCGRTELRDILTLYSRSKLLLTSDSGPAHFAAITPVKTIVLFGPETPVLYAPRSSRTKVLYNPPPCSPCYNVYNNRLSPCGNNICMQRITVNEVMKAVNEVLL